MTDQADNETTIPIRQVTLDGTSDEDDRVAVEEPMDYAHPERVVNE